MRSTGLLIAALLLTNCGWSSSRNEKDARLNRSALYAPPSVTMIPGETYRFREGEWTPRHAEKLHSHFSYMRAITIGSK